jgi:hypothetical protein
MNPSQHAWPPLPLAEWEGTHAALHRWMQVQFHAAVQAALQSLRIPADIRTQPCEIADALPFDQDTQPRPYDGDAARRWWRILLQADRVLRIFRARFCGKCSPVHFFGARWTWR